MCAVPCACAAQCVQCSCVVCACVVCACACVSCVSLAPSCARSCARGARADARAVVRDNRVRWHHAKANIICNVVNASLGSVL